MIDLFPISENVALWNEGCSIYISQQNINLWTTFMYDTLSEMSETESVVSWGCVLTPCKWNLPVTTSNFPQNVNLKSCTVNKKKLHFSEELYFKTLNQNFLKLCGGPLGLVYNTTSLKLNHVVTIQYPPPQKKNMILKSRILNKPQKKINFWMSLILKCYNRTFWNWVCVCVEGRI